MNAPLGDSPQGLTGLHVVDADGVRVGTVQQVYRDDATNDPEWVTVRTGLFGMKETFIPLPGARRTGGDLHVPYTKDTIKQAPRIDADGHLDPSEEERLYRHYGLNRPGEAPDPGGAGQAGGADDPGGLESVADEPTVTAATPPAAGAPPRATARTRAMADTAHRVPPRGERNKLIDRPTAGAGAGGRGSDRTGAGRDGEPRGQEVHEVVLSEEQVEIGTEERVSGRAYLRKHVVTEEVHRTVPVSHEEVRVVREKITEEDRLAGRTGPRSGGEQAEVVLHEETPTVSKKMVPVERVWLETERVTEQREITTEVHREEVEIDDGTGQGTRPGPDRPR
ncbi:PRC and DUF2382 domain-containing protein [Streptomyces lydicus]|uniref:Photosystem reaction center subunit H n=1 Tax=Streptomyces lydicus TaxID=47763 RepID=A0A1D7VSB7_9ACTN|nr:PRC and DUF2382 domain-containing protein [Streptomyces lydicus]AOP49627.1 hypothetical protein SL103_28290 [Streptomyces lydicus]